MDKTRIGSQELELIQEVLDDAMKRSFAIVGRRRRIRVQKLEQAGEADCWCRRRSTWRAQ